MGWAYVPGLAESNSDSKPPLGMPTELSLWWRGKPFVPASWRRALRTAPWIARLSGTILPPSTLNRGVALWISSLAGSRASHGPAQASDRGTKTRVTCGRTLPASSPSAAQLSFFSKTCRGWCLWDCDQCAPIYDAWVTQFRLGSLARQKSALRTFVSDCSSLRWPTPIASSGGPTVPQNAIWNGQAAYRKNGTKLTVNLQSAVDRWPTPTVRGNHNRKGASKSSGDGLATAVNRWPTPTARDHRSGKASAKTRQRNSRPLSEVVGALLSPAWVTRLMGFPDGWVDGEKDGKTACQEPAVRLPVVQSSSRRLATR